MLEQLLTIGATPPPEPTAFLGEVPVSTMITGDALANRIGLTAGIAQHSNEPWLHFELDGRTLYVAKKTYRHTISWESINSTNAVFGTRTIDINGLTYKVRLLKGANSDPYVGDVIQGYDLPSTYGSEWNRLFYPLIPNPTDKPTSGISGEGIRFGSWASYTESELTMGLTGGNGRRTWCQETQGIRSIARGIAGVTEIQLIQSDAGVISRGWRPVLELVE